MVRKAIILILLLLVSIVPVPAAAGTEQLKPDKLEKCPVCGMFVHKYPDWTAKLVFSDGAVFYFDGVKDMMKYIFNLEKYNPGKNVQGIRTIQVTDYYDLESIDGRAAYYVVGSDTFGPMGRELIPFATAEAAAEFQRDHGGADVLTFDQITPAVVGKLD